MDNTCQVPFVVHDGHFLRRIDGLELQQLSTTQTLKIVRVGGDGGQVFDKGHGLANDDRRALGGQQLVE